MEDSGMQKLTQGRENLATGSPDDRAQVEEQAVASDAVAVTRDQNYQIPADNGAGPGSKLLPISTVAGAPQTRAPKYQLFEIGCVTLPRPLSQLPRINISAVGQLMNLASSSGGANLQSISAAYRRRRDLRLGLVPEERDDGDISEELSNAVAADDDIPAGHIRVRVTVHNTCPIGDCRSKNYVRFMTIVSPEDALTRLSETMTAYFYCYRRGCDITFELEEDPENRCDDSSRSPCPQCNSPLKTNFLFSSRFWKRFTRQPCGGKHGKKDKNPESDTLGLDRLNFDTD